MIKKIVFIQIIFFALCAYPSFSLSEEEPANNKPLTLSKEEKDKVKLAKIIYPTLNDNWIQEKNIIMRR